MTDEQVTQISDLIDEYLLDVTDTTNLISGISDVFEKELAALKAENERLKGWLWQYREELKSTNVFHANQGIINAIDKILPKE